MAKLIKCPDCNKKVSVNASTCPNCGAPSIASVVTPKKKTYTKTENKVKKISLYVIVLSVLIIMLVTCIVDDEKPNKAVMTPEQIAQIEADKDKQKIEKEAKREQIKQETDRLVTCQIAVQKQLKNPKSFDTVFNTTRHAEDKDTGGYIVGFDFYAKNSFNAEIIHRAACSFNADGSINKALFEPK